MVLISTAFHLNAVSKSKGISESVSRMLRNGELSFMWRWYVWIQLFRFIFSQVWRESQKPPKSRVRKRFKCRFKHRLPAAAMLASQSHPPSKSCLLHRATDAELWCFYTQHGRLTSPINVHSQIQNYWHPSWAPMLWVLLPPSTPLVSNTSSEFCQGQIYCLNAPQNISPALIHVYFRRL